MSKYTVAFYTLGCKVNRYETDAMEKLYRDAGFDVVPFDTVADVYVINTCTVTALSDKKSGQMIRRAIKQNSGAVIIAAGCYSQSAPDEVGRIPGVSLVLGTKERGQIVEFTENLLKGAAERSNLVADITGNTIFERMVIDNCGERSRAYIKIQDGCDRYCSYCKIPYVRGPARSREIADICDEVISLTAVGYKEFVLTGIHLASYGKDFGNESLVDVVKAVSDIQGVERIRLGSLEPSVAAGTFVAVISKIPELCRHFHLSLQSGCERTLKRMNRKYSPDEYSEAVSRLRSLSGDVSITTDVIVGFPGETEDDFDETCRFVEQIGFAKLHIFPFSPRKGTAAYTMKGRIDKGEMRKRVDILTEIAGKSERKFAEKLVGTRQKVLTENIGESNIAEGYSENYIKILFEVGETQVGDIVNIGVKEFKKGKLYGIRV